MAITHDQKKEIYYLYKNGTSISELSKIYGMNRSNISYLIRLIDKHGIEILRTSKNRAFSRKFKLDCITQVLNNHEEARDVSINAGLLSQGLLHNWIREYKRNGYNVVEKKRGRIPVIKKEKTVINDKQTAVEKLREENEHLKAEVEFLKKWNAVVQSEEKRKQKKLRQ